MTETKPRRRASIPETLMLARLAQAEQMREFFIEMWLQNPAMTRQAGARVQAMLSPLGAVPPASTLCREPLSEGTSDAHDEVVFNKASLAAFVAVAFVAPFAVLLEG